MFRTSAAKTATDFEPSTEVFPPIAVAQIARKLNLEKRGRADGEENYPAPAATGLTTAEQEAVNEITRLRKRGIDAFDTHFNAYQGRIDLSQSAVSRIDVQAGKLRNEMVSESKTQQNIVMNRLIACANSAPALTTTASDTSLAPRPRTRSPSGGSRC